MILRGGSGKWDSVMSGGLASRPPPDGGEPKERGNEENTTESRSDLPGTGGGLAADITYIPMRRGFGICVPFRTGRVAACGPGGSPTRSTQTYGSTRCEIAPPAHTGLLVSRAPSASSSISLEHTFGTIGSLLSKDPRHDTVPGVKNVG